MKTPNALSRALAAVCFLPCAAVLTLSLTACSSGDGPIVEVPPAPTSPQPAGLQVGVLTPLPPALQIRYEEVGRRRAQGDFEAALKELEAILATLEIEWGKADARLEPYDYDRCVLLREAGRLEDSLDATRAWLQTSPRSLHHRVVEATTLLRLSELAGRLAPAAREAIVELANPGNREILLRYQVEPADLLFGLAGVALREQSWNAALELLEVAGRTPDHRERAHLERGRILLETQAPAAALAELENAGDDLEPRILAAQALLVLGRAGEAWEQLEGATRMPGPISGSQSRAIAITSGKALLNLDRASEARDLVLSYLLEDTTDVEAIRLLAACMRRLDLQGSAQHLERRARGLAAHADLAEQIAKAENAGSAGTETFLRALQLLAVDRAGEALHLVEGYLAEHDSADYLRLLAWDTMMQLGLAASAIERAERVCRRGGSPILVVGLARLHARWGSESRARELLQSTAAARAPTPALQGLLAAYQLRLLVELGELEAAASLLSQVEAAEAADAPHPVSEIRALAQVELGLHAGEADEQALAQSFAQLDGGAAWAGALREVIAARDDVAAGQDVSIVDSSDLLDNPRLLKLMGASAAPILELHERVLELVDGGVLEALQMVYRQSAVCGRRARQLAWYLWSRDSGSLEAEARIADTLSSPEESLDRLAAAERGLAIAPLQVRDWMATSKSGQATEPPPDHEHLGTFLRLDAIRWAARAELGIGR